MERAGSRGVSSRASIYSRVHTAKLAFQISVSSGSLADRNRRKMHDMLSYIWTTVLLVVAVSTLRVSSMRPGGLLSEAVRRDQVTRVMLPSGPSQGLEERAAPFRFYKNNTKSEWSSLHVANADQPLTSRRQNTWSSLCRRWTLTSGSYTLVLYRST